MKYSEFIKCRTEQEVIDLITFFESIFSEKRLYDRIDNYSIANYNDYLWMKENVSKVDDEFIDCIINTENNVEIQVKDFINKFNLIEGVDSHE